MPAKKEKEQSSIQRDKSHDEKDSASSTDPVDAAPEEAKGGMSSYWRVFRYADRTAWILNIVAFIAAVAAGTLLPLMDLVFGKFVTAFNGFAIGAISPAEYRSQVNKYTCVCILGQISHKHPLKHVADCISYICL
jgi:ATP-binding cassette subfamily B (MDR/TAP) protein 1